MSDVLAKIKKRRCYPVPLGDGDVVHVRSMLLPEVDELKDITEGEEQNAFVVGCVLLDESGGQVYPRGPEEATAAYVSRLVAEVRQIPQETQAAIIRAASKVATVPAAETLEKN